MKHVARKLLFTTLLSAALVPVLRRLCENTNLPRSSTEKVINDSIITAKVKAAFLNEQGLRAMDINVETEEGMVRLTGLVDAKTDIAKAGQVAAEIEDVKSVKNDLSVKVAG